MFRSIYLKNRFFYVIGLIIIFLILGYSYDVMHTIGLLMLPILTLLTIIDGVTLFITRHKFEISRSVHPKLSLGDEQDIQYTLINNSKNNWYYTLIDDLPVQLQYRDLQHHGTVGANESITLHTPIRPLDRGEYEFGNIQIFISSTILNLIEFRITTPSKTTVKVVPSIIQMRRYALEVFSKTATMSGIRRIRSIGENDEFEQIRNYQVGDNYKSINWKATARKREIMVNQFQNTRSQNIYTIIDKGRSMKMPFKGLTLLDYAINASLVISNIVLKKYDKAGLITFSHKLGQVVQAKNTPQQLSLISDHLYNQKTDFLEANHELLFFYLRQQLKRRSILLYFTNFENLYDLEINLPYLKSLNRRHLMVVIFFKNTEVQAAKNKKVETVSDIYSNTMAAKAVMEKEQIRDRLNVAGIQTILTAPEDLSVNVINKYLEIKAKRMK